MAYDLLFVDRIRNLLTKRTVTFTDKSMMGGRGFQVDDKMLCGIHTDKKYGDILLMSRIG